jgi:DNA polymerase V
MMPILFMILSNYIKNAQRQKSSIFTYAKTTHKLFFMNKLNIPLFTSKVQAGFPSPADDYIEQGLDLNDFLIKRPTATFFMKVAGDSMKDAGINNDDILIVDRSLTAIHNSIVVAVVNSEYTVKRLQKIKDKIYLMPENKKYPVIEIKDGMDFEIWGVVTYVIHSAK